MTTIPTIRETIRAANDLAGPGVRSLEAGLRLDAKGEPTADIRAWGEDEDLDDFEPLSAIYKAWRKSPPEVGTKLDLYVYGNEWNGLLTNLDLVVGAEGLTLVDPFGRAEHTPIG